MGVRLGLIFAAVSLASCSGMKVLKNPPPQEKPKSGLTMGKPVMGGLTVQKVGFWCDAKGGLLTFGAFGPTEAEARANAQSQCHKALADSPCEIASCKPESQK